MRHALILAGALTFLLAGPLALPVEAQAQSDRPKAVQGPWMGTTAQTPEFQYRLFSPER